VGRKYNQEKNKTQVKNMLLQVKSSRKECLKMAAAKAKCHSKINTEEREAIFMNF
jgi:hypothetical protein